jgi:hypothetical protein
MVVVPIELCMSLGSRSQEIVPRYRVVRIMPSFLPKQQPICSLRAQAFKHHALYSVYARH